MFPTHPPPEPPPRRYTRPHQPLAVTALGLGGESSSMGLSLDGISPASVYTPLISSTSGPQPVVLGGRRVTRHCPAPPQSRDTVDSVTALVPSNPHRTVSIDGGHGSAALPKRSSSFPLAVASPAESVSPERPNEQPPDARLQYNRVVLPASSRARRIRDSSGPPDAGGTRALTSSHTMDGEDSSPMVYNVIRPRPSGGAHHRRASSPDADAPPLSYIHLRHNALSATIELVNEETDGRRRLEKEEGIRLHYHTTQWVVAAEAIQEREATALTTSPAPNPLEEYLSGWEFNPVSARASRKKSARFSDTVFAPYVAQFSARLFAEAEISFGILSDHERHSRETIASEFLLRRAVLVGLAPLRALLTQCVRVYKARALRHRLAQQRLVRREAAMREEITQLGATALVDLHAAVVPEQEALHRWYHHAAAELTEGFALVVGHAVQSEATQRDSIVKELNGDNILAICMGNEEAVRLSIQRQYDTLVTNYYKVELEKPLVVAEAFRGCRGIEEEFDASVWRLFQLRCSVLAYNHRREMEFDECVARQAIASAQWKARMTDAEGLYAVYCRNIRQRSSAVRVAVLARRWLAITRRNKERPHYADV